MYGLVAVLVAVLVPLVWNRSDDQWRLTVTMDGKVLSEDDASYAFVSSSAEVRITSSKPLVALEAHQATSGHVLFNFPHSQDRENSWGGHLTLTQYGLAWGASLEVKAQNTHNRVLSRTINLLPPRVPHYEVVLSKGFDFPKDSGVYILLRRDDSREAAVASHYVGPPTRLEEDHVLPFTSALLSPEQTTVWVGMQVVPHGTAVRELPLDRPSTTVAFEFNGATYRPSFTVRKRSP